MPERGSQQWALREPPPCGASWPRQGKAALYITWHLQNKLEGLENPPAIVAALSLLNFLVGSAALILFFIFWGCNGESCTEWKEKGLWSLIHAWLLR